MKKILSIVVLALILCLGVSAVLADYSPSEIYKAVLNPEVIIGKSVEGNYPVATLANIKDPANWQITDKDWQELPNSEDLAGSEDLADSSKAKISAAPSLLKLFVSSAKAEEKPGPVATVTVHAIKHGEPTLVTVSDAKGISAQAWVMIDGNDHIAGKLEYAVQADGKCHSRLTCAVAGCDWKGAWSLLADHDPTKTIAKEVDGKTVVYCTVCGTVLRTADGHAHKAVKVCDEMPACDNELTYTYHNECDICGALLKLEKNEKGLWVLADEFGPSIQKTIKGDGAIAAFVEDNPEWKEDRKEISAKLSAAAGFTVVTYDDNGHLWGPFATLTKADCIEDGTLIRTCWWCNAEQKIKNPDDKAKGIYYTPVTVACNSTAKLTLTCKYCNGVYGGDHKVEIADGVKGKNWDDLKGYLSAKNTPAIVLVHNFDLTAAPDITVKATCTTAGKNIWVCTRNGAGCPTGCDNTYVLYVKELGHKWAGWTTLVEPDYETGVRGIWLNRCTREGCGTIERYIGWSLTEIVPCEEHTWVLDEDLSEAPTCTEAGTNWYYCDVCGTEKFEEVAATGHTAGEWKTIEEATCTKAGTKVYKCTVCGEYVEDAIPATGHKNVKDVEATAATCVAVGYTAGKYCEDCKTYIEGHKEVAIDKTAHKLGEAKVTKAATCTEEGEAIAVCELCKVAVETKVAALGHDFGEWKTVTAATVDKKGTEERACKREGCTVKETREVDFVPTAAAKYTVKDLAYKSPKATGKVELDKETKPLENVYARVTFFLENGECTIVIVPVKADGTFTAGAMGNYVHVSVIIVDTDDAYSATDAIEHAHGNEGIDL